MNAREEAMLDANGRGRSLIVAAGSVLWGYGLHLTLVWGLHGFYSAHKPLSTQEGATFGWLFYASGFGALCGTVLLATWLARTWCASVWASAAGAFLLALLLFVPYLTLLLRVFTPLSDS